MNDETTPDMTPSEQDMPAEVSAEQDLAADIPADQAPVAPAEEAAPEKPREVIRGIHPELRCQDPECGPEFTELQFFSPEEAVKVKGKIMLFCARSGKKYFAPAPELQTWISENKIKPTRGRRDG